MSPYPVVATVLKSEKERKEVEFKTSEKREEKRVS